MISQSLFILFVSFLLLQPLAVFADGDEGADGDDRRDSDTEREGRDEDSDDDNAHERDEDVDNERNQDVEVAATVDTSAVTPPDVQRILETPQRVAGYPKTVSGTDVIGDGESPYEIEYDAYGRAIEVREQFVLGYHAETLYAYHEKNQRFISEDGSEYYRSVVTREDGTFYRNGEIVASYSRFYDVSENEIDSESQGFLLLLPIVKVMATVYGVEAPDLSNI